MIVQQQFTDAVIDFEGLVADGKDPKAAVSEAALSNGIDPAVFESRLTRKITLEERVDKIRRDSDHNHFLAFAKAEVAKCRRGEGSYKRLGAFRSGAEEAIAETLELTLERDLTEHEVWTIEELWSPRLFDLRQQLRFGIKPVRERPFRGE